MVRLVCFLVVVYAGQWIVYFVCKGILDRRSQFRITRYFRQPKHDIFVLGNSRAVNSIDERYAKDSLHLDVLNVSFNGMPYLNTVDMLQEVNRSNKGSVIYLEISCLATDNGDDAFAYYMSNSTFIDRRYHGTLYGWLPLARLNSDIFLRSIYYLHRPDDNWINRNVITPAIISGIAASPPEALFPDTIKFHQRLDEVQRICATHGNRLILFLAPYYPAYLDKLTDYQLFKGYLDAHAGTYRFVDLNIVQLRAEMFADRVHTNEKGALPLTRYLMHFF